MTLPVSSPLSAASRRRRRPCRSHPVHVAPKPRRPAPRAMPAATPPGPAPATRFEREAFERLVAPHLESMHLAARRIVRSDDLAWDAVQDVLLRVWHRGWLPGEPAGALRHLVSLAALQVLRGRTRRERHEDAACQAPSHRSEGECPRAAAEARELRRDLAAALAQLPADQRRVFEMFELEGHDYACIAEQLAVPVGTVRSRLSRARTALRERLEGLLDPVERDAALEQSTR